MAITPSDFSKIWASNADTPEYTFNEADYLKGWDFVGNLPPTRAMWNAMQKSTDEKMKYVFDNFGAPLTASTVAGMTMQNRVYVYTGSETGYTAGHWYYWNGSVWADGGVYNSNTVQVDPTLTISGAAADAQVTGDYIYAITEDTSLASFNQDDFLGTNESTMTETWGSNQVTLTFTATANPLVYFGLDTLKANTNYTLTMEVVSGSIAAVSYQTHNVGTYINGTFASKIASATRTLVDNVLTIHFTTSAECNCFRLGMVYNSKTVVLKNLKVYEDGEPKTIIKNSAIKDLPAESLDADLVSKLDNTRVVENDNNMLYGVTYTSGKYINSSGVATATGSPMSITDYIDVDGIDVIYTHNVIAGYCAFYSAKSESSVVRGINYRDDSVDYYYEVPTGSKYARFTLYNDNISTAWINTENIEPQGAVYAFKSNFLSYSDSPTNPCDYNGNEISLFHKCLCIGDSLTQGVCNFNEGGTEVANVTFPNYSYPTQLAKITGMEVTNQGMAGKTTKQWYDAKSAVDMSGHDVCIIMLGVNDALFNGGWTAEEETAMDNIIAKIQSENNNIKIYVATIIPALSYKGSAFDDVSANLRTYVENLADDNVVLLDMAIYGHTGDSLAYNAGHLSAYGYFTLANDYKAYISWIIKQNKMDYRFVQFIGTTHSYSN